MIDFSIFCKLNKFQLKFILILKIDAKLLIRQPKQWSLHRQSKSTER